MMIRLIVVFLSLICARSSQGKVIGELLKFDGAGFATALAGKQGQSIRPHQVIV